MYRNLGINLPPIVNAEQAAEMQAAMQRHQYQQQVHLALTTLQANCRQHLDRDIYQFKQAVDQNWIGFLSEVEKEAKGLLAMPGITPAIFSEWHLRRLSPFFQTVMNKWQQLFGLYRQQLIQGLNQISSGIHPNDAGVMIAVGKKCIADYEQHATQIMQMCLQDIQQKESYVMSRVSQYINERIAYARANAVVAPQPQAVYTPFFIDIRDTPMEDEVARTPTPAQEEEVKLAAERQFIAATLPAVEPEGNDNYNFDLLLSNLNTPPQAFIDLDMPVSPPPVVKPQATEVDEALQRSVDEFLARLKSLTTPKAMDTLPSTSDTLPKYTSSAHTVELPLPQRTLPPYREEKELDGKQYEYDDKRDDEDDSEDEQYEQKGRGARIVRVETPPPENFLPPADPNRHFIAGRRAVFFPNGSRLKDMPLQQQKTLTSRRAPLLPGSAAMEAAELLAKLAKKYDVLQQHSATVAAASQQDAATTPASVASVTASDTSSSVSGDSAQQGFDNDEQPSKWRRRTIVITPPPVTDFFKPAAPRASMSGKNPFDTPGNKAFSFPRK